MIHFTVRLLVAAFAAFAGFIGVQAKDYGWRHYRSEHFEIYSEVDPARAEAILRDLEYYRYYLSVLTGTDGVGSALPLRVYLVEKHDRLENLIGFRPGFNGVHWVPASGGVAIAEVEDKKGIYKEDGRGTLFHEYVHYFLHEFGTLHFPRWYHEGFAEYLATFTIKGTVAEIGNPPLPRFWWLRYQWMPSGLIFAANARFERTDAASFHVGAFYSQAWLYTHMIRSDPKLNGALSGYLIDINTGTEQKEAFKKHFGMTEEAFGLAARKYWDAKAFPVLRLDFSNVDYKPEWQSEPLSDADVMRMKARLRMEIMEIYGAAEIDGKFERFLKKMQRDPETAQEAGLYLAEAAINEEKFDEAAAPIDAVLAAEPDNRQALLLKSRLLFEREASRHGEAVKAAREAQGLDIDEFDPDTVPFTADAASVREAQKLAYRVLKQNRQDGEAYYWLAKASLYDTDPDSEVGLKAAKNFVTIVPQNDDGRFLYARMLFVKGRYAEAKPLLQDIAWWDADDWSTRRANQMLARIQQAEDAGQVAVAAAP